MTTKLRRLGEVVLIATLFAAARFLLPLVYQDCTDLPPTVREREGGVQTRLHPRWHTYPSLTNTQHQQSQNQNAAELVQLYCPDGQYNPLASLFLVSSEVPLPPSPTATA